MTISPLVERISQILEAAGYKRLASPFQIAGLTFDIPAAYVGTNTSSDLVLVADTAFESDRRILRAIEGIGRALDVVKSKRPVTAVLAGPRPRSDIVDALTRVCRVLPVGASLDEDTEANLRNWLAVLLPLTLPEPTQGTADPLREIKVQIAGLDPSITELVGIASSGADAVQSRLHAILNSALGESEAAP